MKFKIYDISNEKYVEDNYYLNKIFSDYFKERFLQYKKNDDRLRCFYSYVLLKDLMKSVCLNVDEAEIKKSENGKPFFCGKIFSKFFFNISHSKNIVVVAIDLKEIGVDVQVVSCYKKNISKKYFNFFENLCLKLCLNKNELFTKYWTKFEAKTKICGFFNKKFKKNENKYKFLKIKDNSLNNYYVCFALKKQKN